MRKMATQMIPLRTMSGLYDNDILIADDLVSAGCSVTRTCSDEVAEVLYRFERSVSAKLHLK